MGSFRVAVEVGHLAGGRVLTLEGFGLAADPVNRRLVPVPAPLKELAAA
ncbi:MAG: hypothetical protein HYT81_05505 [Gemmatimonadetes bacterium]|nr:hypothetical protein [Gemmatimonadota bacterium]